MPKSNAYISFLRSAYAYDGELMPNDRFLKWMDSRRNAVRIEIEEVPFKDLQKWSFDERSGNLHHETGRFFSIEGICVKTNWGLVESWTQPIINQPEIGFLGIITKHFNGVLYFLMQAKIEPGNINYVQLSPTLQATKSNYSKVHKGKAPLYLEYFNGEKSADVLLDQLQSEQGARFLRKRNRNIIIEVHEEIPVHDDFCWLTLGQIKKMMSVDNLVNMDTRTVISGISYGTFPVESIQLFQHFISPPDTFVRDGQQMLLSALDEGNALLTIEEIISWITGLKSKYELEVSRIPLNKVEKWVTTSSEIRHEAHKYFSVIGARVHISNREVVAWDQPLVKSAQEGLIAFIVKKINGVMHFLVQAKIEAGNFDILELAPSVQCLTGNYRKGLNEYEVPFINEVLNAREENILYKSMQSEEGGRFYNEQNLNIIVEAGEEFSDELPETYCWMTLSQLYSFIRFNNYLNIQARSLLAAVSF
jgi:oxidase EvaA